MHKIIIVLIFAYVTPACRADCPGGAGRCDWIQWNAWSDCSATCGGGTRRRDRQLCCPTELLEDCCDACLAFCNLEWAFTETGSCGGNCYHTADVVSPNRCDCPDAYYGSCCESRISCSELTIAHGYITDISPFYWGDMVTYHCNNGYNLTAGDLSRTCLSRGSWYSRYAYWSGSTPRCAYAIGCSSDPCQNGATCVNGLDFYTCMCAHGWSGTHCEFDILPPIYDSCPENITQLTYNPLGEVNWTAPVFSDPHGETEVYLSAQNYFESQASLPWGEYVVQYVGTKHRNGLSTECSFSVSVYPYPCVPLVPPTNGSLACNGWNSRFGEICVMFCENDTDVPINVTMENVYVCGGSGNWETILSTGTACSEHRPRLTVARQSESRRRHYYEGHCNESIAQQTIRQTYIDILREHDMDYMCTAHRFVGDCTTANVAVYCG